MNFERHATRGEDALHTLLGGVFKVAAPERPDGEGAIQDTGAVEL